MQNEIEETGKQKKKEAKLPKQGWNMICIAGFALSAVCSFQPARNWDDLIPYTIALVILLVGWFLCIKKNQKGTILAVCGIFLVLFFGFFSFWAVCAIKELTSCVPPMRSFL